MDINHIVDIAISQSLKDIKNIFASRKNVPNIDYLDKVSFYFKDGIKEAENDFELGGMEILIEGYDIYIRHETMMDMIHDDAKWFAHCEESDPSFYNYSKENERILATIVETIYHEVRHTLSAERLGNKYYSEYSAETKKNGYWDNRFERVARSMQKRSIITLSKILPLLKEVDE